LSSSQPSIGAWHQNGKGFATGDRKKCQKTCQSLFAHCSILLVYARPTNERATDADQHPPFGISYQAVLWLSTMAGQAEVLWVKGAGKTP